MAADAESKVVSPPGEAVRPSEPRRFPAPQLRLHDRQVYVGFGATPLGEGLTVADLALIVPDVSFPFDIAGSAATRYQRKRCRFGYLDLEVDHDLFAKATRRVHEACAEHVAALRLHLSPTRFEGEGLLHTPAGPAPFTFRVGFSPESSAVVACVYDLRLYGPAPLPAPFASALIARAAARAGALPEAKTFGAVGLSFDPVAGLVRRTVPMRGFRIPDFSNARLERVEPGPHAFHLHFASGARPEVALDVELLGTVEGTRAFTDGEALLAQGDLAAAETYYLRKGEAPDAHPFARERLLGLLAARPDAHDLALDVAAALRQARPGAAASYWAEACIRLARGQGRIAGELFVKLGQLARGQGEEASAFQAFAAAGRALLDPAPLSASRAFQDALALRPDDLECLQALAIAADRAADAEGAMRAYRRITALARDPAQAARAHVRLAEMLAAVTHDRPAARLHFDAALRRVSGEPDALVGLARICRSDGEHLRALKLLDELAAEAARRADRSLQALACREAGATWNEGLSHPANALLRYQEAEQLEPEGFAASLELALLLERLGRPAEAAEAFQRAAVNAEAQLGRAQVGEEARGAAHRAHHALARLHSERLGDAVAARRHLEAALALDPSDAVASRALLPAWRAEGRARELAEACERCAAAAANASERAMLLAEAGELYVGPLADPKRAAAVLERALLGDPLCARALEATARLADAQRDGATLCRALLKLVEAQANPSAKAALLRRLAHGARDVAGDLDLAADSLGRALAIEPDELDDLSALCELHRRRKDDVALAAALAAWARALEKDGQFPAAARALRELAGLYDARLGRGADALALLEKAAALAPEDRSVLKNLASLSLRRGRPSVAREAYRALLASLPAGACAQHVADLQKGLGKACEALGDRDSALQAFAAAFEARPDDDDLGQRLEALLAAAGREADRASVRLARGRVKRDAGCGGAAASEMLAAAQIFAGLGEVDSASAAFGEALDADPDGPTAPPALDALVKVALDARDSTRASDLLARRARFDADGRSAARRLARAAACIQERDPARFRMLLGLAVERDGEYPPVRATLAKVRAAEGEPGQALAHARIALAEPNDPDALNLADRAVLQRLAARAALEIGEIESARALLAGYCDAQPDDVAALVELAGLHRRTGARADLATTLDRLARRQRSNDALSTLHELGALFRQMPGRRADALGAWRRALQIDPADRASLEALCNALDQPSEASERVKLLRRRVELTPDSEGQYRLLCECGETLLAIGDSAAAAASFSEAATRAPKEVSVLERLAAVAQRVGDAALEADALARRACLAAEAFEPDAAERLFGAGAKLAPLGRVADACSLLEQAAGMAQPESTVRVDALALLSDLYESAGELRLAAEVLLRLADGNVGSERCALLLRRAAHLRASKDATSAREAIAAALAASPGDRRALTALRDICLDTGDDRGLAEALEALLALPLPDRREAAARASQLADVLLRLGEDDRAEIALRRTLAFDRAFPGAQERLFRLLIERGASHEALSLGERLARGMPGAEAGQRLLELSMLADRELHDGALALRLARLAYERAPGAAVRSWLVHLLYARGAVAEALPLARELVRKVDFEAEPEDAREQHLQMAELTIESGERALAVEILRGLLEREPTDGAAADLLYSALLPSDPVGAVTALAQHARALAPGSRARALFIQLAGDARARLGAPKAAAELLELALAMGEDHGLEDARLDALREAGDARALVRALRETAARALEANEGERALALLDELAAVARAGEPHVAAEALDRAAKLCAASNRPGEAARRFAARGQILRDDVADSRAAELSFRRAFQLDGADIGSGLAAAALCRQRGDTNGEAELLEAIAPRLEPRERCETLVRLAELCAGMEEAPAAIVFLEEALRIDPRLTRAREAYEQILHIEDRVAELARSWEERADFEADPARRADLLERAAGLYLERLQDGGAGARALQTACEALPADLRLAEACAEALCAVGRHVEARPLDAKIVEADPTRERPFQRRATYLMEQGDLATLAGLYEARAVREAPIAASVSLLQAAAIRRRLGDAMGAARDEEQAFELDPSNDRAFTAVLAHAGTDAGAVSSHLARRAQAVPREALALHRARGQLLAGAGQLREAAEALDGALDVDPQDPEALALRADLAETLEGDAAAEPFDRALLDRQRRGMAVPQLSAARACYRLGFLALARGEESPAHAQLEAAFALDPLHPHSGRALDVLASHYARAGERAMLFRVRMSQASRASETEARAAALSAAADAAPETASLLAALTALADLRPNDAALLERLATALRGAERTDLAAAAFERAAAASDDPRERSRRLLDAASLAASLDEVPRARGLRQEAWNADRSNLDAARALLGHLRAEGDSPLLQEALAQLAAQSGNETEAGEARFELARRLDAAGDRSAADAYLDIVRRGAGAIGFVDACRQAEHLLREACRWTEAAEALAAVARVEADPPSRASKLIEAARMLEMAAAPGAEALLREAAESAVEMPEPWAALARHYASTGEARAHATALEEQAARQPDARSGLLVEAARLWFANQNSERADRALQAAYEAAPHHVEPRRAVADACEELGLFDRALSQILEIAGAPDVDRLSLLKRAAGLAQAAHRQDDAYRILRSIFELDPGNDAAWKAWREGPGTAQERAGALDRRERALALRGEGAATERVALLCERAQILAGLADPEGAEQAWCRARELDPRCRVALAGLRELAAAREDGARLVEILEAEVAAAESGAERFSLLVEIAARVRSDDPARAALALEQALSQASGPGPDVSRAEHDLAELVLETRPARALELLDGLAERAPEDVSARALAARACLALGDPAGARRRLREAIVAAPENERLLGKLEEICTEAPADAAWACERRAERACEAPSRLAHLLAAARAWRQAHEIGAEKGALRRALEVDPGCREAFERLAELLADSPADLLPLIERYAEHAAGDRLNLQVRIGELRLAAQDAAGAVGAFETALCADPGSERALEGLARARVCCGRLETADLLARLGSFAPEATAPVALAMGRICEEEESRLGDAVSHYALAAAHATYPTDAIDRLSRVVQRLGTPAEALEACECALRSGSRSGCDMAALHLKVSEWYSELSLPDDAQRHLEIAVIQGVGGAEALRRLADLYLARGTWPEAAATLTWFAEQTDDLQARGAAWRKAVDVYANNVGDPAQAAIIAERALVDEPEARDLLESICELAIRLGEANRIIRACERLAALAGDGALERFDVPFARALCESERGTDALRAFKRVLAKGFDADVAERVRDLAEAQGDVATAAAMEIKLIERSAPEEASRAAERLRILAGKLSQTDPAGAADLVARAFALSPGEGDLALEADLHERAGDLSTARRPLLLLARARPFDAPTRSRLLASLRACGDVDRAAALESLALGAPATGHRFPAAALAQVRVDDALRARLYDPLAAGPLPEMLRLLAPALSESFGGDLARHGVTEADRVGPLRAPALAARIREAREVVGLRALEGFLAPVAATAVALEPGTPDSLVVSLAAITDLEPGALSFLLVRASELSRCGCALPLQAGSDGLEGLLRCALAACGVDLAVPDPFDAMVEPTARALQAHPVPSIAPLLSQASQALIHFDPAQFLDAMERSAARVALVACGEPGAARRVLATEGHGEGAPLAADLVLTCLRDDYGELRRACVTGDES